MLADVNIVNGGILKKTLESESERGVIKMKLTLVRPTLELKEKALEYRQEHFDNNETIINGSELLDNEASVKTIVKNGGKYERSFEFEGEEADVYKIVL